MTNWEIRTVAELASPKRSAISIGPFGSRLTADNYVSSGMPVVRGQNITDGKRLDEHDIVYVSKTMAQSLASCIAYPGDLVFPHRGAIGRVGIVTDHPWLLSTSMMKVSVDLEVASPEFVFYYFRDRGRAQLLEHASIVGTPGIAQPLTALKSIRVPLPPLREQHMIAKFLSAIDDKIAANDRVMAAARELAIAHFARTVAADPGQHVTLGNLADRGAMEFSDGYRTKRAEHGTPGIRILRAGDVRDFRIYPSGADFVSREYQARIGSKLSREGDIVLTTKGTVGRVAIVSPAAEQIVYSPQTCYFRIKDGSALDLGYLAAWFGSQDLLKQLSQVMHKSDMAPYVNLQDIRSLHLPLPSMDAQRAEGRFQRPMINVGHALAKENDTLARTRDELLPLLMSGRVRVCDAERILGEVV